VGPGTDWTRLGAITAIIDLIWPSALSRGVIRPELARLAQYCTVPNPVLIENRVQFSPVFDSLVAGPIRNVNNGQIMTNY